MIAPPGWRCRCWRRRAWSWATSSPYSGTELNASMDRHAEAEGRPYLGVELRQDQIADATGQTLWAERLARICSAVALAIA